MHCLVELFFGAGGNAAPCQAQGWSEPEPAFTWTIGPSSILDVPCGPLLNGSGAYFLELRVNPFTVPRRLGAQTLRIQANGTGFAQETLFSTRSIAYRLPEPALRAAAATGRLTLAFFHPDFARPCDLDAGADSRPLAFMMHTLRIFRLPARPPADITVLPPLRLPTQANGLDRAVAQSCGLDAPALLDCFESLGQNCEFGLVQRRMGAEPLGLLRFAGIDTEDLLTGLRQDFTCIGEDVTVEHAEASEYLVRDQRYKIGIHSFSEPKLASAQDVLTHHVQRIGFLHRHFLGRLKEADRIFVFQRPFVILPAEARALHIQLQKHGANALLFVDQAADLPNGAVAQLDHGLYHGKLDRLAPPGHAADSDLPGWMSLCINAYRLWRR